VPFHEHRRRARALDENQRQLKESIKISNKKNGSAKATTTEDIFDAPFS